MKHVTASADIWVRRASRQLANVSGGGRTLDRSRVETFAVRSMDGDGPSTSTFASTDEDACLPDTQGAPGCPENETNTPTKMWGHLFSLHDGFCSLDLVKEKYTFGRFSTCDVVYQDRQLPACILSTLSKVHFTIERDKDTQNVFLVDESSNGTYINEVLVGRGERTSLQTNDQISLVLASKKTYTFVGKGSSSHATGLPPEVTEKYVVSRKLGSGAFGQVCLVFNKETKARYALKTVQKSKPGIVHTICNEAKLLLELDHPCIIKVVTSIDTINSLHIILELMEGGDLLARIREVFRFQEAEAKFIIYQIALAVKYLHDKNISHRDLKMENILLVSKREYPHVKLADFGLSRSFGKSLMTTYCGTPAYVAPEILTSPGRKYTKEVDIWSLGVITYISLSGEQPFKTTNTIGQMQLEEKIIRGYYFFPKPPWDSVSVQAIDAIKQMLNIKPEERLNITQVLAHAWLMNESMKKKAHAMLRIPLKRPKAPSENVEPNRRKK